MQSLGSAGHGGKLLHGHEELEMAPLRGKVGGHPEVHQVALEETAQQAKERARGEDAAMHVDVALFLERLHGQPHRRFVGVEAAGGVDGEPRLPSRGGVHGHRVRAEIEDLAGRRTCGRPQVGLDELGERRGLAHIVEGEATVGNGQAQHAFGLEDGADLPQPTDDVGYVLDDMGGDHVVEGKLRGDGLAQGGAVPDEVDFDDAALVDVLVLGVLDLELLGGGVVEVVDAALLRRHDGVEQRADLQADHPPGINAFEKLRPPILRVHSPLAGPVIVATPRAFRQRDAGNRLS